MKKRVSNLVIAFFILGAIGSILGYRFIINSKYISLSGDKLVVELEGELGGELDIEVLENRSSAEPLESKLSIKSLESMLGADLLDSKFDIVTLDNKSDSKILEDILDTVDGSPGCISKRASGSVSGASSSINRLVGGRDINPTSREILGSSTWTLLHTIGAVYPEAPSASLKKDLHDFISILSRIYPCGECIVHFQALLKQHPPQLENHRELNQWLCNIHNVVNKRLEKEIFDCERLMERWDCGCKA